MPQLFGSSTARSEQWLLGVKCRQKIATWLRTVVARPKVFLCLATGVYGATSGLLHIVSKHEAFHLPTAPSGCWWCFCSRCLSKIITQLAYRRPLGFFLSPNEAYVRHICWQVAAAKISRSIYAACHTFHITYLCQLLSCYQNRCIDEKIQPPPSFHMYIGKGDNCYRHAVNLIRVICLQPTATCLATSPFSSWSSSGQRYTTLGNNKIYLCFKDLNYHGIPNPIGAGVVFTSKEKTAWKIIPFTVTSFIEDFQMGAPNKDSLITCNSSFSSNNTVIGNQVHSFYIDNQSNSVQLNYCKKNEYGELPGIGSSVVIGTSLCLSSVRNSRWKGNVIVSVIRLITNSTNSTVVEDGVWLHISFTSNLRSTNFSHIYNPNIEPWSAEYSWIILEDMRERIAENVNLCNSINEKLKGLKQEVSELKSEKDIEQKFNLFKNSTENNNRFRRFPTSDSYRFTRWHPRKSAFKS